mmetsp:Transcript_20784/g.43847  ORF Transcript_20784/g.43847 Transcript_20784/m.43847 type:complete len:377 (-) Transcript_20784:382-1512(-)
MFTTTVGIHSCRDVLQRHGLRIAGPDRSGIPQVAGDFRVPKTEIEEDPCRLVVGVPAVQDPGVEDHRVALGEGALLAIGGLQDLVLGFDRAGAAHEGFRLNVPVVVGFQQERGRPHVHRHVLQCQKHDVQGSGFRLVGQIRVDLLPLRTGVGDDGGQLVEFSLGGNEVFVQVAEGSVLGAQQFVQDVRNGVGCVVVVVAVAVAARTTVFVVPCVPTPQQTELQIAPGLPRVLDAVEGFAHRQVVAALFHERCRQLLLFQDVRPEGIGQRSAQRVGHAQDAVPGDDLGPFGGQPRPDRVRVRRCVCGRPAKAPARFGWLRSDPRCLQFFHRLGSTRRHQVFFFEGASFHRRLLVLVQQVLGKRAAAAAAERAQRRRR